MTAAIKREAGKLTAPPDLSGLLAADFDLLPIDASLLEAAASPPSR